MSRRLSVAGVVLTLVIASLAISAGPVLAAPCDGSSTSLLDGGFETPDVPPNTFQFFPQASVPPWQTTDVLGDIEIWGTGFNGVPAAEGDQFAEINANSAGTLYQDVITNPGDTMTWTLQHRGRAGADTMQVLIGDANVADVNGSAGWDYVSLDLTDGTSAWGTHTDSYTVPAGQTCTRFAFRAVSTASGNDSVGNFLDDVSFAIAGPTPTPTPTPAPTSGAGGITPPPTATLAPAEIPRDAPPSAELLASGLAGILAAAWILGRSRRRRT